MEETLNLREKQEKREHKMLSPYAAFSDSSIGRVKEEKPCDIRTEFQRDRDRILHCKAFRRLKDKTQVFFSPKGDHYRTRLTHTLEVSQIARTIAKALQLNEELTEAIALGHDLGHTPFGHTGENALAKVTNGIFSHNKQSIRIVTCLENSKRGLNLTKETLDGILNHKIAATPMTLEGKIVRLSDKIAYINHDIDDSIRAKILKEEEIPKKYTDCLGHSSNERLDKIIHDIVNCSEEKNDIFMSANIEEAFYGLREYMFEQVYTNVLVKEEEAKAEYMIIQLFEYYRKHIEQLPEEFIAVLNQTDTQTEQVICDYIAGMTDHYAIECFKTLMIPTFWSIY